MARLKDGRRSKGPQWPAVHPIHCRAEGPGCAPRAPTKRSGALHACISAMAQKWRRVLECTEHRNATKLQLLWGVTARLVAIAAAIDALHRA